MTKSRMVIAGALFFALSGTARAAILYTPILQSGGAPNLHDCEFLNVSKKTVVLTVGIYDYQGNVEFEETIGVGPGAGGGIGWSGYSQAYCRLEFQGAKSAIRASLCVRSAGSGICNDSVEAR